VVFAVIGDMTLAPVLAAADALAAQGIGFADCGGD